MEGSDTQMKELNALVWDEYGTANAGDVIDTLEQKCFECEEVITQEYPGISTRLYYKGTGARTVKFVVVQSDGMLWDQRTKAWVIMTGSIGALGVERIDFGQHGNPRPYLSEADGFIIKPIIKDWIIIFKHLSSLEKYVKKGIKV